MAGLGADGIHVNFHAVDTAGMSINSMLQGFEESNSHLTSLFKPLKAEFTGSAAETGIPLVERLERELGEFRTSLNAVRGAIEATGGSAGRVQETDKAQAARFLGI